MAIHLLHIRKAGGTALKYALRQAAARSPQPVDESEQRAKPWYAEPWGRVCVYPHNFRLNDVPDGDYAIFSVRDPATRFVSGFYSRLRKGIPRNFREWSEDEAKVFEWFSTPQDLALALAQGWGRKRKRAKFAMETIKHLRRPMVWWTGPPKRLRTKLPQVLYIARQETLDDDWENLKSLLNLPEDIELPTDPVQAHRTTGEIDRELTPKMLEGLRDWYADDYKLLEVCEEARREILARPRESSS